MRHFFFATHLSLPFYFRDECEAIGDLAGVEGTDVFCHRQCMVYPYDNCPEDKCRCTTFRPESKIKLYGINAVF